MSSSSDAYFEFTKLFYFAFSLLSTVWMRLRFLQFMYILWVSFHGSFTVWRYISMSQLIFGGMITTSSPSSHHHISYCNHKRIRIFCAKGQLDDSNPPILKLVLFGIFIPPQGSNSHDESSTLGHRWAHLTLRFEINISKFIKYPSLALEHKLKFDTIIQVSKYAQVPSQPQPEI